MAEEYRTEDQLYEIACNVNNGNFKDAAVKFNKYGFSVTDIKHIESKKYMFDDPKDMFDDGWYDIALVAELAMRLKLEKANERYYNLKNQTT